MEGGCMQALMAMGDQKGTFTGYPLFPGVDVFVYDLPQQKKVARHAFNCTVGVFEIVYCLAGALRLNARSKDGIDLRENITSGDTSFFYLQRTEGELQLESGGRFTAICFQFSLEFLFNTPYKSGCLCDGILQKHPAYDDPLWFFSRERTPLPLSLVSRQILDFRTQYATRNMFLAYKETELLYLQTTLLESLATTMPACSPEENSAVHKAYDILMADLADPPRLSALAEDVGLSKSRITGLFRSFFGDTVYGVIRKERLKCARHMLAGGMGNVTEVAYECGFSSTSHLTKAFTRRFGVNPKQFQLSCRNQSASSLEIAG